ncbi:unnamed protein product [Schistosoma curassoni]|uniref:Tcp10_C domain-containing protein n=1 Tax=Schistosoma curassoni TaxID=6186 RepID=A0A183JZH0_9TREM|nr:unnamed protein product [Schistosoma curassoni]
MEAGDQQLVHTPFVPAGYWSPCAPLVLNPVKAPDIRFSGRQEISYSCQQINPDQVLLPTTTVNSLKSLTNEQICRQFNNNNGVKEILLPNGQREIHSSSGIKFNQLEDLYFADDLVVLSHTHEQIQMKTTSVAEASAPWLAVESTLTRVSSYLGLVSWMYLHLRVDVHSGMAFEANGTGFESQSKHQPSEMQCRVYPDGTTKTIFPDGRHETRYSSGRLRIKDANGNLLLDTRLPILNNIGTNHNNDYLNGRSAQISITNQSNGNNPIMKSNS